MQPVASQTSSTGYGPMVTPAILSVSLLTIMASAAVSPALPEISGYFAGVDQTLIKLILTLPSLIVIPVSLIAGTLAARYSKKTILFVGLAIYVIAGAGGGLARTIAELLVIRGVLGIGIGLIMPLSTTLIMDFFEGQARARMMGFQASFNQLGGMALLAVSGWLACYSWRYSFAVYGLAMVTVVFVALWLPNSAAQPAKQAQVSTGARLSPALFGLGALGMTMMAVFFVTTTDLGLFIQQEKPVFSSQRPMFSSPEELSTHLANGTVSETARAAFAASGVTLSPAAKLTEVQAKQAWQISDGTKRYSVRKEAGALVVSASLGTPALVGYALATMTLTGVVAGLVMSVLFGLLGFYLVPVGAVLMGVGYLLLAQCNHLWMIFAAMVFIGLAQGLMSPPLMLAVPKFVAANARALGVAVMSSSILFGQFVSPLLTEGVTLVSGNDGFRFRFNFLAAFLIGSAVVGALALLLSGRAKAVKAAQAA